MPRSGALTVWIAQRLVARLAEEAERHRPNETGGILLGHRNGQDVVVRNAVDAGPRAVRWKTGMRPDADYQAGAIATAFEESDGAVTYVGEWHSHPHGIPWPSERDRQTLRNIAGGREAFCPQPVMLILGSLEEGEWLPIAWGGRLGRLGRWGPLTVMTAALQTFSVPSAAVDDGQYV